MTTGQFVFAFVGLVLAIFGASWLNTHQIDKRLEEMNRRFDAHFEAIRTEIRGTNNRMDDRFKAVDDRFRAIEETIKEIKADLKQIFTPVRPS
jgi:chromosome segregation ATPase